METPKCQHHKEDCPLCGEPNPLSVAYCHRCRYRLPWADLVEGVEASPTAKMRKERGTDEKFKRLGLLPPNPAACRFCEQPIIFDATRCPHCHRWLISRHHEFEMDPWQADFTNKASQHVDMLQPKAGCLAIVPLLVLAVLLLWH